MGLKKALSELGELQKQSAKLKQFARTLEGLDLTSPSCGFTLMVRDSRTREEIRGGEGERGLIMNVVTGKIKLLDFQIKDLEQRLERAEQALQL